MFFFVTSGGNDDAENQPEATAPRVTELRIKNLGEGVVSEEADTPKEEPGAEAEEPKLVESGESVGVVIRPRWQRKRPKAKTIAR